MFVGFIILEIFEIVTNSYVYEVAMSFAGGSLQQSKDRWKQTLIERSIPFLHDYQSSVKSQCIVFLFHVFAQI